MKRTFVSLWQVVTKATKVSSTVKHLKDQGSGKTRNISMRFVFFHFLRLQNHQFCFSRRSFFCDNILYLRDESVRSNDYIRKLVVGCTLFVLGGVTYCAVLCRIDNIVNMHY